MTGLLASLPASRPSGPSVPPPRYGALPLSRGSSPPQRYPTMWIHHSGPSTVPGHVASSHLPRASTPSSPHGLPGVFQPGALSGFALQSLTWQKSSRLSAVLPLLRLALRPVPFDSRVATRSVQRLLAQTSHEAFTRTALAPPCGGRPSRLPTPVLPFRSGPYRSMDVALQHEHWRDGSMSITASLQGFHPSAGWGRRRRISPSSRHPGSPGISPP